MQKQNCFDDTIFGMRYIFENITNLIIFKNLKYFLLLLPLVTFGQKQVTSENQDLLWTRYHLTLNFSDQWKWVTEADNRIFLNSFHRSQFITHTHVHRSLGKQAEVSLGFTYNNTLPAEPFEKNLTGTSEYRPFQEFYFKENFDMLPLKIQHRFRSEERFFKPLEQQTSFNWRFRYQLSLAYPINQFLTFKINDELFINAGQQIVNNTFDANRLYTGLAFKIKGPLRVETGYLRSVQQLSTGTQYLKRDNIRLSVFHQINLKSDERPL